MPELPEVETTLRGLLPHIVGRRVVAVRVREPRLRWRVPAALARELPGQTITSAMRRAKYLLVDTARGTLILHLGMSGSLRVVDCDRPPSAHDHLDIVLEGNRCLRLRDPRRFGSAHWTAAPSQHPLLRNLGPEPLGTDFTPDYLFRATRSRRIAIRDLLLNARIVAGIGNIYANEALFDAAIRPARAAGRITHAECERLVASLRATLERAIRAGGTTLRDFQNTDGEPGYFQQTLKVYGREKAACLQCGHAVRAVRLGQRRAFYCPECQR